MKDSPHTARFAVTCTYSNSYHGEAEKRSHRQSRFTDFGCISLQKRGFLTQQQVILRKLHFFDSTKCVTSCIAFMCGGISTYVIQGSCATLISKCFILPRLIIDIVMLDSVLLLKQSLIII